MISYVNYKGETVELDSSKHAKPKSTRPDKGAYHNGWRVVGHAPGAMEEAMTQRIKDIATAEKEAETKRGIKIPPPWNEDLWRRNTKKTAVRSKPYEVPEAAQECKRLAERAGWLDVEIIEIKKDGK